MALIGHYVGVTSLKGQKYENNDSKDPKSEARAEAGGQNAPLAGLGPRPTQALILSNFSL